MKIIPTSDIHLEHNSCFEPIPNKEAVLIIAGDLSNGTEGIGFLEKASKNFKKVLYVLGNHEYYNNSLESLPDRIKKEIYQKDLKNVWLLDNDILVVDDTVFIGTTLWSEVLNQDITKVKDYNSIQTQGKLITSESITEVFYKNVGWLFSVLSFWEKTDKKIVVVTHNLPSFKCIHHKFLHKPLNEFFASHLDKLLEAFRIDCWVFGHTHKSFRRVVYDTELICNPFGYDGENFHFDPDLTITL